MLIRIAGSDKEPINDNESEILDLMQEKEKKAKKSKNPRDRTEWIEIGILKKRLEEK